MATLQTHRPIMSGTIPAMASPVPSRTVSFSGLGASQPVPSYSESASGGALGTSPSFQDLWGVTGHQKGLVTCTEISPGGSWLATASQDSTLLFVDFKGGVAVTVLDLESRFDVTATVWRSDSILVLGCSNGAIYQLTFDGTMKRPSAMRTMLKLFDSPIRALAFDLISDSLAVACGGEAWVFVRALRGQTESWDCIDQITAPTGEAAGLVTALSFFRAESGHSSLFIGHAMAGWCIWVAPRSYYRTPYVGNGQACTIAAATIAPSGLFIAISTIESSIVTYAIEDSVLVLESKREGIYQESTTSRRITPIAITPSGLIMKGTTTGDIPMLDSKAGLLYSLHHGNNQSIRTLKTYGDYLIVGSTDAQDVNRPGSSLKCYAIVSGAPKDTRRFNSRHYAVIRIPMSHLLPFTERVTLFYQDRAKEVGIKSGFLAVGIILMGLAMFHDPPTGRVSEPQPPKSSTDLVSYHPIKTAEPIQSNLNPTLTFLIRYGVTYALSRLSIWALWAVSNFRSMVVTVCGYIMYGIKGVVYAIAMIPKGVRYTYNELPVIAVEFICDILRAYEMYDVCPRQ